MMRFALYGCTEKGPVREENEDLILVDRAILDYGGTGATTNEDDKALFRSGMLAAVSDGMGGHAAGALAARTALETLDTAFNQVEKNGDLWLLVRTLRAAATRANLAVLESSMLNPECKGMGATIAGVALMGREYVIFNAGDSRVYRLRHGVLRLLTEDDTVVALAVRAGHMTPQEAENSPSRHYLTNAVGTDAFELHLEGPQSLRPDDTLIISSDGLHSLVDLETMERVLAAGGTAEERCAELIAEALGRGGHDNISVVLLDAKEDGVPTQYG